MVELCQAARNLSGYEDGEQLQQRDDGQGISERCNAGTPVDDGQERDAAQELSHEQSEFMVEEVGVFTALLEFRGSIDHLQLDGIVCQIQKRLGQDKATDKNQRPHGVDNVRLQDDWDAAARAHGKQKSGPKAKTLPAQTVEKQKCTVLTNKGRIFTSTIPPFWSRTCGAR